MTAEEVSEGLTEFIAGKLQPALEEVMAEVAQEVRTLVSEPYPPASSPGQAPHRRSGKYRGSWSHHTARFGDTIRGEAGTSEDLGVWLEGGTSRMAPRPHVATVYRSLRSNALSRIQSKL